MRLHVLSDLHLEFAGFRPPETDADTAAMPWLKTHVGGYFDAVARLLKPGYPQDSFARTRKTIGW